MTTYQDAPMIELTGLYENTSSKTGRRYLVGYWGNTKLIAFENTEREANQPHFRLYIQENTKKKEKTAAEKPKPEKKSSSPSLDLQAPADPDLDAIPF